MKFRDSDTQLSDDLNEKELFNFKEFEVLVRAVLVKAGFKAPIMRRERVMLEDDFQMIMEDDELSIAVKDDL
jgi:hypothetical protein